MAESAHMWQCNHKYSPIWSFEYPRGQDRGCNRLSDLLKSQLHKSYTIPKEIDTQKFIYLLTLEEMPDTSQIATLEPRILPELRPTKPIKLHQLCEKCHHIVHTSKMTQNIKDNLPSLDYETEAGSGEPLNVEKFQHYKTRYEVLKSAFDGCHMCSFLLPHYYALEKVKSDFPSHIRFDRRRGVIGIHLKERADGSGRIRYVAKVLSKESLEYSSPPHDPSLRSFRTDSLETFSIAQTWLQTCLDEHQYTCNVKTPSAHTSLIRLVKISIAGTKLSLQLCENLLDQKEEPYFTLSHCWGGKVPLQLKTENRTRFLQGIPVEDLPQTFWDAVVIVARLGYEYIWIDSLCIIQDSELDWGEQVLIMGEIYRNSLCTIAPFHAKDSSQGCFVSRMPLGFDGCRVGSEGLCMTTYDKKNTAPEPTKPSMPWPLFRRAWVVQERALSPRSLYYGPDRIFWECSTLR